MTEMPTDAAPSTNTRAGRLTEIARVFLKIGGMSYGIGNIGVMQLETQEKRQWLGKEEFVQGLALVNMLPGPPGLQLAIFLGHARGALIGGILAGLGLILPAFLYMLALSAAYVAFGALPTMRSAFYGLGPVVVGIFAVSVYRLGKPAIKEHSQIAIAVAAAGVMFYTSVDLTVTLLAAGFCGITIFNSRRTGIILLSTLITMIAGYYVADYFLLQHSALASAPLRSSPGGPRLWEVGVFFFKVGAFTFGGGLSILAFMQEQVVNQLGWLTPKEFVDGLALGRMTPGPPLMIAAFVGFKLFGIAGAAVAAAAIFLPSFLMFLPILPLLQRMRDLLWLRAFMRGAGPAVIGALAVSVVQIAPHAAPDVFTWILMALTVGVILLRNVGPLPLVASGAVIGLLAQNEFVERLAEWAWSYAQKLVTG